MFFHEYALEDNNGFPCKLCVSLQTIKTNVIGTLNMLGLAKRVGARYETTCLSSLLHFVYKRYSGLPYSI